MTNPFWKSALLLRNYKRQLALALTSALVPALCFGAGLSLMIPTFDLLLGQRKPLSQIIEQYLSRPGLPTRTNDVIRALAASAPTDPLQSFFLVLGAITALGLVGGAGRYIHELVTRRVVLHVTQAWRGRLFDHLIGLPTVRISALGAADNISRLVQDTHMLAKGFDAILSKSVIELLQGGAGLGVALALDWRLTLIALVLTSLSAFWLGRFGKSIRRGSRRTLQHYGRLVGVAQESLLGIRVVKVHNAEKLQRSRFARINQDLFREEVATHRAQALVSPLLDATTLLMAGGVAGVAGWYVFQYNVEPARFLTLLIALIAAGHSLKTLTRVQHKLNEAAAAAARLCEVLESPAEHGDNASGCPPTLLPRHHCSIQFDKVSFTYPGQNRPALQDINLVFRHGQTVAIVGANGSGKTTLLSLLPRLTEPSVGRVLIDGVDIATVSLPSVRKQMAVVTQEILLFEGSIADNIAFGASHASFEKIRTAARTAGADEFIQQLPRGYQTSLGELGAGLSTGQRQRVTIARALLRDPAILILDEATSQIDTDAEARFNDALRALRGDRTILFVAHHLSAVCRADIIVVMLEGQVVDTGTHDELVRGCETYRSLFCISSRLVSAAR